MSAAFDFEIFSAFMREARHTGFECHNDVEEDYKVRGALLYLCGAMQSSGYCDFQFTFDDGVDNGYYTTTREYLNALECRSLLQPWLEERFWPADKVAELKAAYQVTLAITNKES